MSRWVSGLAGTCSFMSVPVHTGRREEAGQRALSREMLQPGCLLHTHSPPRVMPLDKDPSSHVPCTCRSCNSKRKFASLGRGRKSGERLRLTQPILGSRGPCYVSLRELALPIQGAVCKESLSLSQSHDSGPRGKKSPNGGADES